MKFLFPLLACATLLSTTQAQDKGQYNLLNPTPRDLMRPLDSEVYDNVPDAHTLDAGHFQFESSLVNYYEYYHRISFPAGAITFENQNYQWAPGFRVGLFNNVDFEVIPRFYSETVANEFISNGSQVFKIHDLFNEFGDIELAPKINIWGNDQGRTSLAIRPFLNIPTGGGDFTGGIDLPFGLRLPYGFYVKADSQFYVTDNRHTSGEFLFDRLASHYGGFYNAISLHYDLGSKIELYTYLDTTVTTETDENWFGYTGFGIAYKITPNFELFGGMGFGVTDEAYDYNPRFGVIFRY